MITKSWHRAFDSLTAHLSGSGGSPNNRVDGSTTDTPVLPPSLPHAADLGGYISGPRPVMTHVVISFVARPDSTFIDQMLVDIEARLGISSNARCALAWHENPRGLSALHAVYTGVVTRAVEPVVCDE